MAMHGAEPGIGHLKHYDTIILGAGVAGLACASRLLQMNHAGNYTNRLRILEARNRIGGRVASVDVQGCRLDTGANWIHGTGNAERPNPLMDILPHKRYRQLRGSVLFQAPISISNTSSDRGSAVPADVARLIMSSVRKAISQVQDFSTTIPVKVAKHMSVLQALGNAKAFQDAFELVPSEYHHTLSVLFQGIESMEAAPLLAQTTEPQHPESKPGMGLLEYVVDEYEGEQAFLQDGYVAVVDEIARPLVEAASISLETVVKRIDWTRNPIIIETSQGNYSARQVVCTIPLGVLKDSYKDALFMPSLPAAKQEAIENLGFGTLDKIFAVYSRPWWEGEPYMSIINKRLGPMEAHVPDMFLGFTPELEGISVNCDGTVSSDVYRLPIINLHSLTGQPVLGAFVSCKTATTVEGMTDDDISALFHRALTQWFGSQPPKPDAVHVTRWARDPYSRGAYSHMIAGLSEGRHREVFQEPVFNDDGAVLRFAGEHCSKDHFAMVHGALLDGWRVADAISKST